MIHAAGLTRVFDGRTVVQDLSFDVPEGKLFALLGPNGAGKTTTVRMLLGLIASTRGSARVAGFPLGTADANAQIRGASGLLTETPGFYDRLSAWDNLLFFGRLYGMADQKVKDRVTHYLRLFQLWDRRDGLVGTYSKGMKQRLALARALFHDPKVVFLHEPTDGLDPEATLGVRELVLELKREGRTLLMCTHNLDEAERLADIVGILKRRLIACDTLAGLRSGRDGQRLLVRAGGALAELAAALKALPFVRHAQVTDSTLQLTLADPVADVPAVVEALVRRGAPVYEVRAEGATLEAIYLRAVREDA
jgi:ABC-2 type transport system ATP-binding protein